MTQQEKQLEDVLKGRFIKRVFQESIKDIDKAQVVYLSGHGFNSPEWFNARSFVASETALEYSQLKKHRFVDMKTRNTKKGKIRKKAHPVHNKILYGHYNNIIRELSVGFTEAIKEQLRELEQ